MTARLTPAQVMALEPGDRVSRVVRPGEVHTAPVERVTATQVVITWPDGEGARYWRETGQRTSCRGEVLREPEMEGYTWIATVHRRVTDEAERHGLTEADLSDALATHGSSVAQVLAQAEQADLDPLDTATLIVAEVLRLRLPSTRTARPRAEVWTVPAVDWAAW